MQSRLAKFEKIIIWGPNVLNNRLLARHVHSVTNIVPSCITEAREIEEMSLQPSSMFICDCDKIEPKSYCRKIHRTGFSYKESPAIVLLNISRDQDILEEINTYAIHGVFFISDQFELLDKGLRNILTGDIWLSRDLLVRSLQCTRELDNKNLQITAASELTFREREILRLVGAGLSNQAIADRLYISTNTVKTHISNIYKKIDVINRVQAIIWANEYLKANELSTDYMPVSFAAALKN